MTRKSNNLINQDLFKNRRKERKADLFLLRSNKEIIITGLYTSGGFILLVLIISIVLFVNSILLKNKNFRLKPYVIAYDNYQNVISKIEENNKRIINENKRLSNDILNIRSGSSILSEITALTPKEISLFRLNLIEESLEIKGIVNLENGLKKINLFMLELDDSPFLKKGMTKLIRTKIEDQDNTNNLEKEPTKLNFTITTLLSDDLKEINKKKLFKLGSLGLAKRVNLIIKRGLIK